LGEIKVRTGSQLASGSKEGDVQYPKW